MSLPARRLELWNKQVTDPIIELKEEPPPGFHLHYPIWKALNRLIEQGPQDVASTL